MALTVEKIQEVVDRIGYRVVNDRTAVDSPRAYAEARSPRIEILQRAYGRSVGTESALDSASRSARGSSAEDVGAIVMVEPKHGGGRPKAIVLSEEGEILGEQG